MIKIFSMICMFCIKVKENNMTKIRKLSTIQVMGHPASEPILPDQMRNVAIAFFFLIGILFHLLLSYLGY